MMLFVPALLLVIATAVSGQRPGAVVDTNVSPTDEAVVFAVQSINNQFIQSGGQGLSAPPLRLVQILRARTQVVNGRLLYLQLQLRGLQDYYCNVTVLTRQWEQGRSHLSLSDGPFCSNFLGGISGARFRRQASAEGGQPGLVGGVSGPQPVPLPRPGQPGDQGWVLDALAFAACAANDRLNNRWAVTLSHTLGATYTQQVTSGLTYRFYNVPIAPTNCRNQGCARLDTTACPANQAAQERRCFFQVQFQAWATPQYQLTDINC